MKDEGGRMKYENEKRRMEATEATNSGLTHRLNGKRVEAAGVSQFSVLERQESRNCLHPSSFILHPSSFILHPSSFFPASAFILSSSPD
jgi:hypothetical protein